MAEASQVRIDKSTEGAGKMKHSVYLLRVIVALCGLVMVGALVYTYTNSLRVLTVYGPQEDAVVQVSLKATEAHLWTEEAVSEGLRLEELGTVGLLDEAAWYVEALLEGGTRDEVTYVPVKRPLLRDATVQLRDTLGVFRAMTEARLARLQESLITGEADHEYDVVYKELMVQVGGIEEQLQTIARAEVTRVHFIQKNLIFLSGGLILAAGILLDAFLRRLLEQRRRAEAVNQQLAANEQQLRRERDAVRDLARFPSENPFPVLRVRRDGVIVYVNGAAEDILAHWRTSVKMSAPSAWRELIAEAFTRETSIFKEATVGAQAFLFAVAPILESEYANIYGIDVTERSLMEDDLRALNQQLAASEQQLRATNQQLRAANQQLANSEERLRAERNLAQHYLDIAGVILVVLGRDETVGMINRKGCEVLGYAEEEIVGKNWFDLCIPEAIREETRTVFQDLMAGRMEVAEYHENAVLNTVCEERLLAWHNTPLYDEAGSITCILSSGEDITERRQVESERERLIGELEDKNAELERFVYTVSHDLKTPLITIKGYLGMLQVDVAEQNAERMNADINYISRAADKMSQLLDELLALSRIGRQMNPPEDVALGELVDEVTELVFLEDGEKAVQLVIAEDMPTVFGDRLRLREVLQNLIDNAVKFTRDRPGGRVEVGWRRDGEENVCYVRDNGAGIESRYLEQVFELFEKLDPHSEGTGVGLALVKRIIEVHGGRIWVESEGLGKGSCFCFTLPDRDAAPDGADQPGDEATC